MKKEIRDEIQDLAPSLLQIGNRNPYKVPAFYFADLHIGLAENQSVPDDYFATLSDHILEEARAESQAKVFLLNHKIWAVAASIILLCTVSFYTMISTDPSENDLFVLDVELEDAFDYLASSDDIYMDDVLEFGDIELWDDLEEDLQIEDDLDILLDHVTLEDLDEMLY